MIDIGKLPGIAQANDKASAQKFRAKELESGKNGAKIDRPKDKQND